MAADAAQAALAGLALVDIGVKKLREAADAKARVT